MYLKYNKFWYCVYLYSILGIKYVVLVLYLISFNSIYYFLGIGNLINILVDVYVEYFRRNLFLVRFCWNVFYELCLDVFESIDFENNC